MPDKDKSPKNQNILTQTGLNAKSITGVRYWQDGVVHVWELSYTGGPYYFKAKGSTAEYGGTSEWGTGTSL